jgi:Fe2+ or Zn2+ uptake regulation protein
MQKQRGRPERSEIRERIAEILFIIKEGYGYAIYQIYREVFPKATLRAVYYNLEKGVLLNEFRLVRSEKTAGAYSWGSLSDRNYYSLAKGAEPRLEKEHAEGIQDSWEKLKRKKNLIR